MIYASLFNLAMLVFISLSNLEKYYDFEIGLWYVPIILIIFLSIIGFGYLEDRSGFFKEEVRFLHDRSPQITEILEEVKELKKIIEERK
jgi:heme/copper-type cytochrome/quinol oxidase subunit 2